MQGKTNSKSPSLGQYLHELRVEKGLTLEQVGEATDLHPSLISRIENGTRTVNIELIPALSKVFGISEKTLTIDLLSFIAIDDIGNHEHGLEGLKKAIKQLEKRKI